MKIKETLFERLPVLDDVVFSGGLGSQILAQMNLEIRRAQGEDPRINVDYFYQSAALEYGSLVDVWRWELDHYGFELPKRDISKYRKFRNFFLPKHGRYHPKNLSALRRIRDFDFREFFPLSPLTNALAERLGLQTERPYLAIHLRRGDYLDVSMRVVAVSEILELLEILSQASYHQVVIFSDSPIAQEERVLFFESLPNGIIFCTKENQHAVHGLMRKANLLIASNSTFSFTAGLLSEPGASSFIAPQHFFPGLEEVNSVFQAAGMWMIGR